MVAFLAKPLVTIALCWRLERRDGVALGFTTHDRDLAIGGLVYRAAPGMLPSSITRSDGFDLDTLDVEGALTSDAITAADLKAGRWDGAAVSVFMVDWEEPEGEILHLARGELGEVSIQGDAFEAELKGPTAALDRPAVEQTSPECRARLGDKKCRVDLAGLTRTVQIVAVASEDEIEVDASAADDAWRYGRLRWLAGANSGLERAIMGSAGAVVTLRDPPALAAAVGDLVELIQGCDRRLATCVGRFGNAVNFRGEPHLPGMDLLTRYPGA
ncbi:DUF2163 domain-containing protein [Sphingosinicella sp.]|uniref:DUF2163 domain-containing protein n=1 Tax=Sphingosinicella sp. TaxID=1917971 RepID=UPI004037901B